VGMQNRQPIDRVRWGVSGRAPLAPPDVDTSR
jgi:hypothetical protein